MLKIIVNNHSKTSSEKSQYTIIANSHSKKNILNNHGKKSKSNNMVKHLSNNS